MSKPFSIKRDRTARVKIYTVQLAGVEVGSVSSHAAGLRLVEEMIKQYKIAVSKIDGSDLHSVVLPSCPLVFLDAIIELCIEWGVWGRAKKLKTAVDTLALAV